MRLIELLEASTAPVGEPYMIFPDNGTGTSSQPSTNTQPSTTTKLTVGQINKALPLLRTRDLQSIKKNVDAVLAAKQRQPQVAATQPTAAKVKPTGATGATGAFGAMASQLSSPDAMTPSTDSNAPRQSSSGGTITQTPTGTVHRANPANAPMSSDELERYRLDAYRASRRALGRMYETQSLCKSKT